MHVGYEADSARREAERMYTRVLMAWAQDYLQLRRSGLERPGWRVASDGTAARDLLGTGPLGAFPEPGSCAA